jgi:hypothetical protein
MPVLHLMELAVLTFFQQKDRRSVACCPMSDNMKRGEKEKQRVCVCV